MPLHHTRLSALAAGFEIVGETDPVISGISDDSRRVRPGMLFVAVPGTRDDGHRHVAEAVARGAAAVAVETAGEGLSVPVVRLSSSRAALAVLAARFERHPAKELALIGFTGTFGKTSTSAILRDLLAAGGAKPGVLGSLGARYRDFHDPGNNLTTPAPVEMHRALRGLKDAGADTVIMEVTSHALRLGRADGLTFAGGLLSAIRTGEHADFHGSFEDYVAAKRLFLRHLAPSAILAYDADDVTARAFAGEADVAMTTGFSRHGADADVRLTDIVLDHTGARFRLDGRALHSPLLGHGHLENVALALAYALSSGVTVEQAELVLRRLEPLPRRMERREIGKRLVLDDTAGHPDSLQATFDVAAMLARSPIMPGGSRIVVAYAIRGSRGADINRRNAVALSDLSARHAVHRLIVTASQDTAGVRDRATVEEIDAARAAFAARRQALQWCDTLEEAARAALDHTRPGDLIVLVGAQGMDDGQRLLGS